MSIARKIKDYKITQALFVALGIVIYSLLLETTLPREYYLGSLLVTLFVCIFLCKFICRLNWKQGFIMGLVLFAVSIIVGIGQAVLRTIFFQ